jgi:hypothetical protein
MNKISDYLGEKGWDLIADNTSRDGNWCAVGIVEDATFTTLTAQDTTVYGTLTNITFPAGYVFGGGFTTIQLASGTIMAYRK